MILSKFSPLLAAALVFLPLAAQTAPIPATLTAPPAGFSQTIVLWPAGAPLAHGTSEGDIPKLFSYPAPGPGPHTAVLVMPGGGYTHVVIEKEGAVEARWLNAHGVSAFVLEYRLSPAYRFPAPMLDAARALRFLRAHAAQLQIDPHKTGLWGFSAGGHLGGFLATTHDPGDPAAADPIDRLSDRPDFAILAYGRLDLGPTVPRPPQTATARIETVLAATTTQLDVVPRINADTSPTFLYSTSGDQTVDSRNSTDFYNALKAAGVPAELHVFERGPHGTGLGLNLAPNLHELSLWPPLLANWMQQNGWMPATPSSDPGIQ